MQIELLDLIVSFTTSEKYFIVASLFLYFGNDILPLINNETSFSKGTYNTWKKKLYKKIPITNELYDSLTNIILTILEV